MLWGPCSIASRLECDRIGFLDTRQSVDCNTGRSYITAGGPNVLKFDRNCKYCGFITLSLFQTCQKFPCLKLIEIVNLWVYYTIPFGFNLFWHHLVITFQRFKLHCLTKDHWRGFSTRNAHMVHIVNLIRLKMVYTS